MPLALVLSFKYTIVLWGQYSSSIAPRHTLKLCWTKTSLLYSICRQSREQQLSSFMSTAVKERTRAWNATFTCWYPNETLINWQLVYSGNFYLRLLSTRGNIVWLTSRQRVAFTVLVTTGSWLTASLPVPLRLSNLKKKEPIMVYGARLHCMFNCTDCVAYRSQFLISFLFVFS